MPFTFYSLVIPNELTQNEAPTQLAFFNENGTDKLLLVCPGSRQIIEVTPEEVSGVWGGSTLLREIVEAPLETISEMKAGELLGGGGDGFLPLNGSDEKFSITRVGLAHDGIELELNAEVDRFEAVKPENFQVQAVLLSGGAQTLTVVPTVESDGRTVILKTESLPEEAVIRIICHRLPSAAGDSLLSNAAFYTIHKRPRFEE